MADDYGGLESAKYLSSGNEGITRGEMQLDSAKYAGAPDPTAGESLYDRAKRAKKKLIQRQNYVLGITSSIVAMIIGSFLWIAAYTIGQVTGGPFMAGVGGLFMALTMGGMIGWCLRVLGKGVDISFGILGAGLALFGCVGSLFLAVYLADHFLTQQGADMIDRKVYVDTIVLSPWAWVSYICAMGEAFMFSYQQISEAELAARIRAADERAAINAASRR